MNKLTAPKQIHLSPVGPGRVIVPVQKRTNINVNIYTECVEEHLYHLLSLISYSLSYSPDSSQQIKITILFILSLSLLLSLFYFLQINAEIQGVFNHV